MHLQAAAERIVEIGQRLYQQQFIVAFDGNLSQRLDDGTILATPTGMCKGALTPEVLVRIDEQGQVLEGKYNPSSEIKMHLAAYRLRKDVHAVVHAHPPIATAFACTGRRLDSALVAELVLSLGTIPTAPYGTPSTSKVPDALEPLLPDHDGILLANHGALALGKDLLSAYYNMETIEHFARIALYASQIGDQQPLTRQQLSELVSTMEKKGISNPAIAAGRLPRSREEMEEKK